MGTFDLQDDPADHCGILSWYSQKRDRKLREAGSYGYLVNAHIPISLLQETATKKEKTDESGLSREEIEVIRKRLKSLGYL